MSAFPSAPRQLAREPPKKLVYVWLHKTGSDKQYVGSTTTGLLSRCKSHIRTATVQGQLHLDRRADSQMVQSEPLEMYTTWRQYGLGNFVCIPVSILRDDATTLQVREEEQRWMDILGTLGPNGYKITRLQDYKLAPKRGARSGAQPRLHGHLKHHHPSHQNNPHNQRKMCQQHDCTLVPTLQELCVVHMVPDLELHTV